MLLLEETLMNIEHDKLTDQYTLRIPEILSVRLSKLSPDVKKTLNVQLMVTMAKVIHHNSFNPETYLNTRD